MLAAHARRADATPEPRSRDPKAELGVVRGSLQCMGMTHDYAEKEPARAEVDALAGPTVLEFGSAWCGFCRAAQPLIEQAFARHPEVRHIKIADGSGRRLGRSFGIKLWPTLVFIRDGVEAARLVRPHEGGAIREALKSIDPA
jgi:thioredoxin 1